MAEELVLSRIKCTTIRHKRGHCFAPRAPRDHYTLVYVSEGILNFIDGERSYIADSGTVLFIPEGSKGQTVFIGENNRHHVFYFNLHSGSVWSEPCVFEPNDAIRAVAEECADNRESMLITNPNYYTYCLYRIIYLLQDGEREGKYAKILPAVKYIERNYAKSESVSKYAEMVCMSESGFRKLFTEYTGKSPVEYRNHIRLLRAEELILSGASVSEAAEKVGFGSISFYCRLTRRNKNASHDR